MKNIKLFLTAILFFSLSFVPVLGEVNVKCAMLGKEGYYDLTPLAASENNGKKFYPLEGGYEFNLCKAVVPDCAEDSGDNLLVKKENGKCKPLVKQTDEVKITENAASTEDITLIYNVTGEPCGSGDRRYTLVLELTCDRDKDADDIHFEKIPSDQCTIRAKATVRKACPIFSLTYLYEKYPVIFAVIFLACGLLFTFFGLKLYKIVLFLLAAFVVGFLLLTIIYQMILLRFANLQIWAFWVVLGISALVGLTVGYFAAAYNRYCFVLAGASLGGIGGFILYTAILASFVDNWMVYVIVALGAIVCAIINWFLRDPIVIAGTALTGSYLFVSGVGFFTKGFPSIFDLYEMIKTKTYDLDYKIYCYLGGVILLALIGMVAQCKMKPDEDEESESSERFLVYTKSA